MIPPLLLSLSLLPSARAAHFVVNDTADATDTSIADGVCATSRGVCTLRAAIVQAGALTGPDTIEVPDGVYPQLTPYQTSTDITITGAGQGQTVLLPLYVRAFQVDGGTLVLSDLTIRGGIADKGGAIYLPGDTDAPKLIASDIDIEDCTAMEEGGGLYVGSDAYYLPSKTSHATLTRVRFRGNSAYEGAAIHANGWYADGGSLQIRDCELTENTAVSGAGLNVSGFPDVVMEGGLIAWNEAVREGAAIWVGDEWAIVSDVLITGNSGRSIVMGDGPSQDWGKMELRRSIVRDNHATNCVVRGAEWGSATVSDSLIGRNTAGHHGGAVCGSVHVISSAIVANIIHGDGGAFDLAPYLPYGWSLVNSTVAFNRIEGSGGAVHFSPLWLGPLWGTGIRHATIVLNVVDADGDGVGIGGGISSPLAVPIESSVVAGNTYGAARTPGDCLSPITSTGANLFRAVDAAACAGLSTADLVGTPGAPLDPMLLPGQWLGATWWGFVPREGSPLVDGAVVGTTAVDQRGAARPVDGDGDGVALPDIGSIERVP